MLATLLLLFSAFGGNYPDQYFGYELPVIRVAAERNGIDVGSDDWYLLLAIRKAENGGPGRQFGVMNAKAHNLDLQAAWAAATIRKNRARWRDAGKPGTYTAYLAGRYCPESVDPVGHRNWLINVPHWQERLRKGGK